MGFKCDICGNPYLRKDSLARHKRTVHGVAPSQKRKHLDDSDDEQYAPLERSDNVGWKFNQVPGFARDEPLQRSDAVPEHDVVRGPNNFGNQALAARSQPFTFKDPFCMTVAGPSRSGKTQWVVQLLKERRERIEPPVEGVVFCYAHLAGKIR